MTILVLLIWAVSAAYLFATEERAGWREMVSRTSLGKATFALTLIIALALAPLLAARFLWLRHRRRS